MCACVSIHFDFAFAGLWLKLLQKYDINYKTIQSWEHTLLNSILSVCELPLPPQFMQFDSEVPLF